MTDDKTTTDVQIDSAGPARKRLTITVPASDVDDKIEESMGTLANETSLPGFRKGRAPRELLRKRFGTAVRTEAKNQLVADAYATAIEEHEIKPVSDPEPDEELADLELEDGKPLTFSLEVEVVPDFELPALDGIEVKKPVMEVSDELLGREIDRQRTQFGRTERIDGEPEPGDRLLGAISVIKDGDDEPFFSHDSGDIVYPGADETAGTVLGLVIDDLASIVKGKTAGDEITIKTTGPDHHEREEIRGAAITISFKVSQVVRTEPASMEEVLQQYGMPSEEILREQVRIALEARRDQEQAAAMRDQLSEHLVDAVDFELPEKLTSSQAQRTLQQLEVELLYRGLPQDQVDRQVAESRAESEDLARRRLKLHFLLHRLAQDFDVQVSEGEINGRVAALATQRGLRPEQLRNELAQSGRLNLIANQIRDHKIMDRVLEKAKITEITAEEWEKQVSAKRGAGPKKKTKTAATGSKKKTTTKKTTTKKKTTKKKTTKAT